MQYLVIFFILLTLSCTPKSKPQNLSYTPLPLKRLTESPSLSGQLPRAVKISPDGKRLSFLKPKEEDFEVLDLWEFDIKTGEQKLLVDSSTLLGGKEEKISEAEQARRERKRIRNKGIIEYYWSKQGDQLLFPLSGDLYVLSLGAQKAERITETEEAELDPAFSPLGNFVSYVRNHNLYIYDLKSKKEKQVSYGGTKDTPIAVAEFIAQEEMGRYRGYWWSADEKFLAAAHVDLSPIDQIERFEIYADKVDVIKQRYPKTGTKNARVALGVYQTGQAGRKQNFQKIPIKEKDYYIPKVRWSKSEKMPLLFYTIQSRDQKTLDLLSYNPSTRKTRQLFTEKDEAWVSLRHGFQFIKKSNELFWLSEADGRRHIYWIHMEDGSRRQITRGDWQVRGIESVNVDKKLIYFSATKDSPLENHLYQVSFDGKSEPQKISKESGYHRFAMEDGSEFYLDYFSPPNQPISLASYNLEGTRNFFIEENKVDKDHPLFPYLAGFSEWEYFEFERPSLPKLFYKVLKPKNFDPNKKYPVIQYVYGGPGVQLVTKSGGRQNYFFQILAQNGFVVVVGDNRGTPGRGRDFERAYYKRFGDIEIADQSAIIENFLSKNKFADPQRLGVFGHSYGGYLTLMLMMQKSDLYKVGVSGAPVTDWSLYDTHYTERYIGTPEENPEVYKKSNVLTHAENLKGKLLVAHGMADDNVLFSNSLVLYSALQEAGILFDIQAYPGAKHGIRRKKSWQHHYTKSIFNYFKTHL